MRGIERLPDYAGGFVFFSLSYSVLWWVLQLVALRLRSNDFKDLEIVMPATSRSADNLDRPDLPDGGQPAPATRTLAVLHHHTRTLLGGSRGWWRSVGRMRVEPGASRSAVRSQSWCSVRARQPAVGLCRGGNSRHRWER